MLSSKLYNSTARIGIRYSHHAATAKSVPSTRGKLTKKKKNSHIYIISGNIQDPESFLKAIGRNCGEFASKFEVIIK